MSPEEFLPILQARFPQVEFRLDPLNPQALIMSASGVPEVFGWLRDAPEAAMEYLEFSTAVDRPPDLPVHGVFPVFLHPPPPPGADGGLAPARSHRSDALPSVGERRLE